MTSLVARKMILASIFNLVLLLAVSVHIKNAAADIVRYDRKKRNIQFNSPPPVHGITKKLVVIAQPTNSNETIPFPSQPKLRIYDELNNWVQPLRREIDGWRVIATIVSGTGDSRARLLGESIVDFIDGTADFTNLAVSHKGIGYKLKFEIIYPQDLRLAAVSEAFDVKERILVFALLQQPTDAVEIVPFTVQPRVEIRDAANGELVSNTGWKGRKWLCTATLVQNGNSGSSLMGETRVEFEEAFAQFTNLRVDSAGKGYQLRLNVLTSPVSTYSGTFTTAAFNVKENKLYLRIMQQPGNCNDTVICGNQPILEIKSKYPNALASAIGWKGSSWYINASMHSGASNTVLNGTRYLKIPTSGLVQFTDLNFYDVAVGYRLKFNVIIVPHNPRFANMSVVSDSFDVRQRKFFLIVKEPPKDANDSAIFGKQPVIEVRDVGTNLAAKPLKRYWKITASIENNAAGNGSLKGTLGVTVKREIAVFTDLCIVGYGVGYSLKFESNHGHTVVTSSFTVRYRNFYRPIFNHSSPRIIDVYENISAPVILHTFFATDKDTATAGSLTYTLLESDLSWLFSLSPTTGRFTLIAGLDRENASSFRVSIQASDNAPSPFFFTTTRIITVNILDVNDNKPYYACHVLNFTIPETLKSGEIAFNVSTTDADAGENGRIIYTIISSNASEQFQLNADTGVFTALVSLDLDGNEQPGSLFHFLMNVHDNGIELQQSVEINVFVRIIQVNEFSPTFNPSTIVISKPEDIPVGSVLATLNATDADSGRDGKISYTITSGNVNGVFGINAGQLIVQNKLDRETQSSYNLLITASDNPTTGATKSSMLTVVFNVLDVNDNRPMFPQAFYILDVPENAAVGTAVVSVVATDGDAGLNGQLEYSVASGSSPLFRLESSTGSFIPLTILDLDSQNLTSRSYHMTVFVTDKGLPFALNNSITTTLRIVAVNEHAPVLSHSADIVMLLNSSKQVEDCIFKIEASDRDYGDDGRLTYSIVAGNDYGIFSLDSTNGHIHLVKIPSGKFYSLEMKVTDHGKNPGPKSTNLRLVLYNERSLSGFDAGSVYVGSSRASVQISAIKGAKSIVPIYANVAFQDLEGIDVTISYDRGIVSYESAVTDLLAIRTSGAVRLFGLVKADSKITGISKIAELTFIGLLSASVNMTPSGVVMADKAGKGIPTLATEPTCDFGPILSINGDCVEDIRDAALIQTYVREMRSNFSSAIGKALSANLTIFQKDSMDVDYNGVIDYYDAKCLQNVLIDYTKSIDSFTAERPLLPECNLKVQAILRGEEFNIVTNTRAFVVFTYSDSSLNTEFTSVGMTGCASFKLKSGSNRYGRVFELEESFDGSFVFTGVKLKLPKNDIGITLVIVVATPDGSMVSSSFVKPANTTGSKSSITVAKGISFDIYDSFEPQMRTNFSSSLSLCYGKTISMQIRLTFNSNFSLIRGKEVEFITDFKFAFQNIHAAATDVFASNFTVRAGSIIIEFDVIILESQESQFINELMFAIKNDFILHFASTDMIAAQTLVINGKENIPSPKQSESDSYRLVIKTIVIVIFCATALAIVIIVCYRKKHTSSKRTICFTERCSGFTEAERDNGIEISPRDANEGYPTNTDYRETADGVVNDSAKSIADQHFQMVGSVDSSEVMETALDNPDH